jgi:hypothetical protein
MSSETSLEHDSGERPPAAADAIPHGSGRAIALAMPFVLQACSAPAPAHATTGVATMASSDHPVAGTAASTGAAAPGAAGGRAPGAGAGGPQEAPIVRVSLGSYPPEREHEVAAFLDYTNRSLGDDIQRLTGLVWYYSGIDRERHAIVNVSLWRDVPSAEQMSKLQAMLDLGAEMTRLGVQFVRPIPNFEPVWTFTGAAP